MNAYLLQIKIALVVAAIAGWTWFVWDMSTDRERAKWVLKESAAQQQAFDHYKKTDKDSYDSGVAYEKQSAEIQKKLTTPDRKLDAHIQGPAGDVILPGALGLRLNALNEIHPSGPAASKSRARLSESDSLSDRRYVPEGVAENP